MPVKESYKKDVMLKLCGYNSLDFQDNNLKVYYKGKVCSISEETNLNEFITLVKEKTSNEDDEFLEYLAQEAIKTSGLFSLIICKGDSYYIISDIIRSQPVFYGFYDDNLFLTNNLHEFLKLAGPFPIENDKLEEYISSGFVYGNGTIFQNIHAIQAGEIISIKGFKITSRRYFEFKPISERPKSANNSDFASSLDNTFKSVFTRMIHQASGVKRWVVPLSGGHDSRCIVNYLYKLGIKNVVCFSYGVPNNEQSNLSKQVAAALNFEWHFVEYTDQKWYKLHESGLMDEFIDFAFNGVSIPHFQDFLAIYELKEKDILKEGDIIIPGHTFDFIAGSNLQPADMECINKKMAVTRTSLMHSRINNYSSAPFRNIENIYDASNVDSKHFQEYFNWQEKRAKFMVNSLRVYEFFNFGSGLPFWDKELLNFWLAVPDDERMERKAFFEAEGLGILVEELKLIPFHGKMDIASANLLENLLSTILPGFIKTWILRMTGRRVKYNTGLNQIYALRGASVKELLEPVEDFPAQTIPYFKEFLNRFPFQVDYHFLTSLYTIRRQLSEQQVHMEQFG